MDGTKRYRPVTHWILGAVRVFDGERVVWAVPIGRPPLPVVQPQDEPRELSK